MHSLPILKALSSEIRLRSMALLQQQGELCVCQLTDVLELPQPKISHHLAALRKADLVSDRKQGLWVYYRINPDLPAWAIELVGAAVKGTSGIEPYQGDLQRLSEAEPVTSTQKCS